MPWYKWEIDNCRLGFKHHNTDFLETIEVCGLEEDIFFQFYVDDQIEGHCRFSSFAGDSDLVICYATYIDQDIRGTVVSDTFRKLKELVAKELGFCGMLCSVRSDNPAGIRNAEKSGYNKISEYLSPRGSYSIYLYAKYFEQPKKISEYL